MEFGKIFIEITNVGTVENPQYHAIATGIVDPTLPITQQDARNLGSCNVKTKAAVIDWFIEKVEAE